MDGSPINPISYIGSQTAAPTVWAVGGGKGGVGKSFLASALAYSVSRHGYRIVAIDLDLGGSNLHTVLGIDPPKFGLGDFVSNRCATLEECMVQTPFPNLSIISGANDALAITQMAGSKRDLVIAELRHLPADIVMVDLGAGTSTHTLEFFNSADVQMITALPEPTSIENAYRFIKASYYDRLQRFSQLDPVRYLIEAATQPNNAFSIHSPTDLLNEIAKVDRDLALFFKRKVTEYRPRLVMNQVRSQADIDVGYSMKAVCKKYFGFDLEYLGYLDYDSSVWQSVRRKRPVLLEFPNSKLSVTIERMANYLLKQRKATGNATGR